jgi:hypothetical protein
MPMSRVAGRKVPLAPPEHQKQQTKQQPKLKSACLSEPSWEQEYVTVQLSKSRDSAHNESPVGFLSCHITRNLKVGLGCNLNEISPAQRRSDDPSAVVGWVNPWRLLGSSEYCDWDRVRIADNSPVASSNGRSGHDLQTKIENARFGKSLS